MFNVIALVVEKKFDPVGVVILLCLRGGVIIFVVMSSRKLVWVIYFVGAGLYLGDIKNGNVWGPVEESIRFCRKKDAVRVMVLLGMPRVEGGREIKAVECEVEL